MGESFICETKPAVRETSPEKMLETHKNKKQKIRTKSRQACYTIDMRKEGDAQQV
jgi:hypothetical protein